MDNTTKLPSGWQWANLADICDIKTGKLNSNASEDDGIYPFFTCSRDVFKINSYAFDCEAVLLAGNNASGDFNVKIYNGKFNAYQRTYVITLKDNYLKYELILIYYKLESYLAEFKKQSIGSNTKYIKLPMIANLQIPLPPLPEQQRLAKLLTEKLALVDQLKTNLLAQLESVNQIPSALLKQAFNGEL